MKENMNKIQIKKYNLQIPSILIENFNDLGKEITEQFKILYYDFFVGKKVRLTQTFIDESKRLFLNFDNGNKTILSDRYFENFTPITERLIASRQYNDIFEFWNKIINFVKEWESSSKKTLHKGTPYYFSAVAAVLKIDLDAALILMHLALTEDKLHHKDYKKTPAYYFLTLNNQEPNQYFKLFVDRMIGFLRDRLDGQGNEKGRYKGHYCGERAENLTYKQFREKFLDNNNIKDEIRFLFVHSIFRIARLRMLQKNKIGDDVIAPAIFTQALGETFIVVESLLKLKYPNLNNLGSMFNELAIDENWQRPNCRQINLDRNRNFNNWVDDCLNNKTLLGDFSLSYGLRNFTFHTIESQNKLWQRYTEVLQSVWNCFFKSVEII